MEKQAPLSYEAPCLITYGDLKMLTKGTLAGSGDAAAVFKP
jgi:hypothetical protein